MYLYDNRITLDTKAILDEYLNGFDYRTSGLAYTSMYMWRDSNQFCWDIKGEYMCLSGISHLELEEGIILPFLFPPLTKTGEYNKDALRETIFRQKEHFEKAGQPFSLRLVPAHMVEIIREAVPELTWVEDRPNYDYVYSVQELTELKGRSFHAKKNYVNSFTKNYDYEYIDLTSDMTDDIMKFIEDFNARKEIPAHEMEMLKMEEEAMRDVFMNMEAAGYSGGAILIDNNIEALAVGGKLGKDTIVEHIEKANVNYRGLYPTMNNEFCKHVASWAKYINREEDMDIPNLRKAKLSYKPIELLEKYIGYFEK